MYSKYYDTFDDFEKAMAKFNKKAQSLNFNLVTQNSYFLVEG